MTTMPPAYSGTIEQQFDAAQAEIDRHSTSATSGLCVSCHVPGPCPKRETAVAIFSRYHRVLDHTPDAYPMLRLNPGSISAA